ncbi:MAG: hypothetical protein L0Y66_12205 [Myxococcaceae bacterium]|nr:hypothetical protein [Myxococcaceae bacterium]MCI0669208.1 hypothetical protein [Myxococcaceae bacterium]
MNNKWVIAGVLVLGAALMYFLLLPTKPLPGAEVTPAAAPAPAAAGSTR